MTTSLLIDGLYPCSGSEGEIWPFIVGPFAPEVPLYADSKLDAQLGGVIPPMRLDVKGAYFRGQNKERVSGSIRGLYLTRRESVQDGHRVRWYVSDTRLYLQKLWVFAEFSVRRPVNQFSRVGIGPQRDFAQTPFLAYIPHTQRDKASPASNPRFARGDTDAENHTRWTAKQALLWCLQGFFDTLRDASGAPLDIIPGQPGWRPQVVDAGVDNNYPLTDYKTNKPWPLTVAKLLRLSRSQLFVAPDGTYVVGDATPADLSGLGGYDGGGTPVLQDTSRMRPTRTRVYFRTEREVRFDFYERYDVGQGETIPRGLRDISRGLENVLILPQDVREAATGKVYQRGTVVTVKRACELWNQDPDNPRPALLNRDGKRTGARIRFSLEFIRRNIMSPAMATQMTLIPRLYRGQIGNDSVFGARASALYNSYRQVFRIPPAWLDFVDSIRLERTAISDPVTGKRAPAPVYMDYFNEFSARYFHYVGAGKKDLKMGENRYAWGGALRNVTDFSRLPLSQGVVAPFKLAWVNQRQGVFKISAFPDLLGHTERRIPSTFDENNIPVTKAGSTLGTNQLSQMVMRQLFRMSIVLSLTLRTPNDARKLHYIDFGPTAPDASGPAHEVIFGATHAGFEWLDAPANGYAATKVISDSRGVAITGGRLTNEAVIEDAAQAVYDQVSFDFEDRYLGTFAEPGWAEDRMPVGHIGSASMVHRDGRIETVYSAEQRPQPPTLFERLPQATQNFLFRLEGQPAP